MQDEIKARIRAAVEKGSRSDCERCFDEGGGGVNQNPDWVFVTARIKSDNPVCVAVDGIARELGGRVVERNPERAVIKGEINGRRYTLQIVLEPAGTIVAQ
ncbi:MAG: hypothetical protein HQ567_15485 [Candidatus Nealsonbacteria bacterium]|nr:hypothetical protein [Candidatus Nealsonbacteria bacterium]